MQQSFRLQFEAGTSAREVFDWHTRSGGFERLIPGWEDVRMEGRSAPVRVGAQQTTSVGLGPVRRAWRSEIDSVVPGESFRDIQLEGPFAQWEHRHSMTDHAEGCSLEDEVTYRLPLGALGKAVAGGFVRRRLERLFTYRHTLTRNDLARHRRYAAREPLDVLVSGASGLVGSALCAFLTSGGHRVRRLVRGTPRSPDEFRWNTLTGEIDARAVEGTDAVIHLAGENIGNGRWTRASKRRLIDSRVRGTRNVTDAIRMARCKPRTFLCASAVGIYGSRGDESLDENSTHGTGFLAELCEAWEKEALALAETRVVRMRFGVILSPAGGALGKMLLPFLMGGGGKLGRGKQWMSWVALDDALGALHHALMNEEVSGALNVVAPQPASNAEFTATLGRVLSRPTFATLPAPVIRAVFGEMGEALLLAGQRVLPAELGRTGFEFDFPELEGALRHQLGKSATRG